VEGIDWLKKKALITSFVSAKKRFGQAVLISLWFKLIVSGSGFVR